MKRLIIILTLSGAILYLPSLALAQDTDGDGMPDAYEVLWPCLLPDFPDAEVDYDLDLLTNLQEYQYSESLNPCSPDTDGDLLGDAWETQFGCVSPLPGSTEHFARTIAPETRVTSATGVSYYQNVAWTTSEMGIAWTDNRNTNFMVYFTRIGADGAKIGPDLQISTVPGTRQYPVLAWSGSEYGLCWDDGRNAVRELYFARLAADGAILQTETRITNSTTNVGAPWLIWNPQDSVFALEWTRISPDGKVYFSRIGADGTRLDGDLVISTGTGTANNPYLLWTGSRYAAGWDETIAAGNLRLLFVQMTAAGDTISPQTVVAAVGKTSANSSLAWTGSEYGMSWYDNRDGNYEIYFNRIGLGGGLIGANQRITSQANNSYHPMMLWTGSEYGIFWQDERVASTAIFFTALSGEGAKGIADFQLTPGSNVWPTPIWTGSQFMLSYFTSRYSAQQEIMAYRLETAYRDRDGDLLTENQEAAAGTSPCDSDSDADGMPDVWEVANVCLDPLAGDTLLNPDGDGADNLREYQHGTDPCLADDADGDGLTDTWELTYSCMQANTVDNLADYDSDTLNNQTEYSLGSNPCLADTDGDGMDDGWEVANSACVDPLVEDSLLNPDGDAYTNLQEYQGSTDPCVDDCTDGDGDGYGPGCLVGADCNDGDQNVWDTCDTCQDDDTDTYYELCNQYVGIDGPDCNDADINNWTSCATCLDSDTDTWFTGCDAYITITGVDCQDANSVVYPNAAELCDDIDNQCPGDSGYGTIDENCDTDGDGLPDTWENTYSCMMADTVDNLADYDSDELNNADEYAEGTDPCDADTDHDGMPDGWEVTYGLNPRTPSGPETAVHSVAYGAPECSTGAAPCVVPTTLINSRNQLDNGAGNNAEPNQPNTLIASPCADGTSGWYLADESLEAFTVTDLSNAARFQTGDTVRVDATVWCYGPAPDDMLYVYQTDSASAVSWNYVGSAGCSVSGAAEVLSVTFTLGDTVGVQGIRVAFTYDSPAASCDEGDYNDRDDLALTLILEDADADDLSDLQEYLNGTDPTNPDTDADTMPDVWEVANLACVNPLVDDSLLNPDGDGADNLREYQHGTDPCLADDTDGDGMPDAWEALQPCLNPLVPDDLADGDTDGLNNLAEYGLGTNPCDSDSDADGMPDSWENNYPCVDILTSDSLFDGDTDGLTNLSEYTLGTNPCDSDSDDDGLTDGAEVSTYLTDPLLPDTDGDTMPDGWEVSHSLNPLANDADADADGDGLANLLEYQLGTDPQDIDTDADTMPDGWEVAYGLNPTDPADAGQDLDSDDLSNGDEYANATNPANPDSDGDTMPDGWEVSHSLNPLADDADADADGDGLANLLEYQLGTDPQDIDTDADTMPDGWEVAYGLDPTDPADAGQDLDSDDLSNGDEYANATNPANPDSDGDTMPDGWEVIYLSCLTPLVGDSLGSADGDSLTNLQEFQLGTDPCNPDTDGDGLSDSREVGLGTSPTDPDSDDDSMGDAWEVNVGGSCGLNPLADDAALDNDADGLSNLQEFTVGTDPCDTDTDGDGLTDAEEVTSYFTNPLLADTDGDGLDDGDELSFGTDPSCPDSDHDNLTDGFEAGTACGLDPLSAVSELVQPPYPVGSELRVSQSSYFARNPKLVWTGSEFGMAWEQSYSYYFVRLDAAGNKIGDNIQLTADDYYDCSLVWTGAEYAFAGADHRTGNAEIYFIRLNMDGTKIGSDLRVTSSSANKAYPSLAWSGSQYGVTWIDNRDGNYEIYFARVSAGGQKLGADVRVTFDAAENYHPRLAWNGSLFGVVFEDERGGGFNPEIYFNRISASGTVLGPELRITTNVAYGPEVEASAGNFLLAWTDFIYYKQIFTGLVSGAGAVLGPYQQITYAPYLTAVQSSSALTPIGPQFGLVWEEKDYEAASRIRVAMLTQEGDTLGPFSGDISTATATFRPPALAWTGSQFGVAWSDDRLGIAEVFFTRAGIQYTDKDLDSLREDQELALGLDPCAADTDADGLDDGDEVLVYDTNPTDPDTDGDSLTDGAEVNTHGTDPLNPDSDGDLMFDGWEIAGASCGLNPLLDDALADGDLDTLANIHEYFNNNGDGNVSDPCDKEKPRRGWPGGGYFGDGDGNLLIGVPDMNRINLILNGRSADYSNAFPADPVIQDMDGNLIIGVPDKNIISLILNGKLGGIIAGSPTELSLVAPIGGATVAEGDTVRIQVELTKDLTKPRAGFGVVFTIVSGAGTLLGGEGISGSGRYDLTALDGVAQMVVRADGSGTILVQVDLPYDPEVHTQQVIGPEVQIIVNL